MANREGILLAELERRRKINYDGVNPGSEPNHRDYMGRVGQEVIISPMDIELSVETKGVLGIAESWGHHIYPDKELQRVTGLELNNVPGSDIILLRDRRILHMNPKGSDKPIETVVEIRRA